MPKLDSNWSYVYWLLRYDQYTGFGGGGSCGGGDLGLEYTIHDCSSECWVDKIILKFEYFYEEERGRERFG